MATGRYVLFHFLNNISIVVKIILAKLCCYFEFPSGYSKS